MSAGLQVLGALTVVLIFGCVPPEASTKSKSVIERRPSDRLFLFRDGAIYAPAGAKAERYPAAALPWAIGYELIVPSGHGGAVECVTEPKTYPVRLDGRLSLTNKTGAPLKEVEVILKQGSVETERAEPSAEAEGFVLPAPVSLGPGGAAELSLFSGGAREVPGVPVQLYDPVGAGKDRPTRRPIRRAAYGATDREVVELHVELDLSAARMRQALPAGEVRVFARRRGGELEALGKTTGFGRPRSAVARVRIGSARRLRARRWQEDYAYDERRRRLLEEIRIELKSECAAGARVILREHLYRGLNWALAYYNDAGVLDKTGSQEIEMHVDVPPGGETLAVYRVVYTW